MINNDFDNFVMENKNIIDNKDIEFFKFLDANNTEFKEPDNVLDAIEPNSKLMKSRSRSYSINKKNKKSKKSKKKKYEKLLKNDKFISKIKTKIEEDPNIPTYLKEKYIEIEINPMKLVLYELPLGTSQDEIDLYFNTLLSDLDKRLLNNVNPIKKSEIGETGKFSIIEFTDNTFLELGLKHSPYTFKSKNVKLKRTKGFYKKHYKDNKITLNREGKVSLYSGESIKLYMGNIPQYLREVEIKKMLESIAPLKIFQLEVENYMGDKVSKGYCIFEYADSSYAVEAIQAFDNLRIGDKNLKVIQIDSGFKPSNYNTGNSRYDSSYLLMFDKIKDAQVQAMLNINQSLIVPSKVIQLLNMFALEDLFEDDFYDDLLKDIKEVSAEYGTVESIIVNRPNKVTGICDPSVGKVFIKFEEIKSAKRFRYKINGRSYIKRTIIAVFYSEEEFDKKEYLIGIN